MEPKYPAAAAPGCQEPIYARVWDLEQTTAKCVGNMESMKEEVDALTARVAALEAIIDASA